MERLLKVGLPWVSVATKGIRTDNMLVNQRMVKMELLISV